MVGHGDKGEEGKPKRMSGKEKEKILKALANKRRMAIVKLLAERKKISVGDLARGIKLSFNATSKHLKILFLADILDREQAGLEMFYRVSESIPDFAKLIISNL